MMMNFLHSRVFAWLLLGAALLIPWDVPRVFDESAVFCTVCECV